MKRSIYLDHAVLAEIQRLAEAHVRSLSGQIAWLVSLGLKVVHRFPDDPVVELEDAHERTYFYPEKPLNNALTTAHNRLNKKSKDRAGKRQDEPWFWSFSAFARVLLDKGLNAERWIEAQIAASGRRLAAEGAGSSPRGYATHLVINHTAREIADFGDEAPPNVLNRWGLDEQGWRDAVAVAFEARSRLEELPEGSEVIE